MGQDNNIEPLCVVSVVVAPKAGYCLPEKFLIHIEICL